MKDCSDCAYKNIYYLEEPCNSCDHNSNYKESKRMIKDSGERREFETGAVRDMAKGKGRFDLLGWNAIHDIANHCENGLEKYPANNVRKGIPASSLFDSAMRHLSKWHRGWDDEDHLVAAAWNIMWLLEQRTTHPELDDIHREPPKPFD